MDTKENMVSELMRVGICGTCGYRCNCLSFNNAGKAGHPVLFCEEFDPVDPKGRHDEKKTTPEASLRHQCEFWSGVTGIQSCVFM